MTRLDNIAPNYGRAVSVWPTAQRLVRYNSELESAVENNEHGQIELVKAYIECVCTTVCVDRGVDVPEKASLQGLFRLALDSTGNRHPKDSSELSAVLGSFNSLCDALSTVRNKKGPTAHGRDGFLESVAPDHSRAFLHVGDLLIGAVIDAHQAKAPEIRHTRDPHLRFEDLNALIDDRAGIEVTVDSDAGTVVVLRISMSQSDRPIELRLQPSRILYDIDRELYLQALEIARLDAEPEVPAEPSAVESTSSAREVTADKSSAPEDSKQSETGVGRFSGLTPLVRFAEEGDSGLSVFRPRVEELVRAWKSARAHDGVDVDLVSSLLATASLNLVLDWHKRSDVLAGMRVSLRRVLTSFAVSAESALEISDTIVADLIAHESRCPVPGEESRP